MTTPGLIYVGQASRRWSLDELPQFWNVPQRGNEFVLPSP
ncbi:MAG: sugar transferase [Ardenticatenaceae bacterium]|nr:sugar transferase [Ardenticatenaceae bacterium]